jgi:ATP:corrinoid adenosyltransferase
MAMNEKPGNSMVGEALRDPDEGLFAQLAPDHRFNRLRTKDPKKLAKRAKLQEIRAIDVSTGRFKLAKQYFEGLIDRVDGGIEGACMVLYGYSGAGKTHILNQLLKAPELKEQMTAEGLYRPLLMITAPSPCTLRTLGERILHDLGYRPRKSLREHEVWDRVQANLAAQGVAILVIDEMHNVLAGRGNLERDKIAMTLKSLLVSTTNPMQIVLSGLPAVQKFVDRYEEVQRRSHFIEMAPLRAVADNKKLEGFLAGVEGQIGIKTFGFTKSDGPQRFMLASRGLIGRIAYFIQEAATLAISLGSDKVEREHLGEVYKRAYRVSADQNPFLMANLRDFKALKTEEEFAKDSETFLRGVKKSSEREDHSAFSD